MLKREDLVDSIELQDVRCEVSDVYGRGTVLKLFLDPPYYIICPFSSVGFFGINESVFDQMVRDNVDFAVAFVDGETDRLFVYDKSSAIVLMENASIEQKTGDYRLTTYDLKNPIELATFGELISCFLD